MTLNLSLLLLRWVLGLIFLAHGSQKLFGWFSGPGLKGFGSGMEQMGLRPGLLWATLAGLAEFVGGLLVVLGLLTPVGVLAIWAVMFVAMTKVHAPKGFWNGKGGIEFTLVLAFIALAIGIAGPGAWSLDYALALPTQHPIWFLVASAVVALGVGALLGLTSRMPVGAAQPQQMPSPSGAASEQRKAA